MDSRQPSRLLSIGEFAAATQLSPKALRLYDEQRILRPAVIDAANGYRYYRDDQIPLGRLIRTLRDMDLPLSGVLDVVSAEDSARAETVLRRFAEESERRVTHQRRAYQDALALVRTAAPRHDEIAIAEIQRPAMTVAVRPFLAERRFVVERFRAEVAAGYAALAETGLAPIAEAMCALVDPVSDEEGRLEAMIPVATPSTVPEHVAIRQLSAHLCATMTMEYVDNESIEFSSAMDALFDWFDRGGYRAAEPPCVSFSARDVTLRAVFTWVFEPAFSPYNKAR